MCHIPAACEHLCMRKHSLVGPMVVVPPAGSTAIKVCTDIPRRDCVCLLLFLFLHSIKLLDGFPHLFQTLLVVKQLHCFMFPRCMVGSPGGLCIKARDHPHLQMEDVGYGTYQPSISIANGEECWDLKSPQHLESHQFSTTG